MSIFEPDARLGTVTHWDNEFHWTTAEDEVPVLAEKQRRPHLAMFFSVLAFGVMLLTSRLIYLQVTEGASHRLLAEGNRIRTRLIPPPRGLILDRNGVVLAKNVASFSLALLPADVPRDPEERKVVVTRAAELAKRPSQEIEQALLGLKSLEPIILEGPLDHETALTRRLQVGSLSGLVVLEQSRREYAPIPGLSHILGYTGKVSQEELEASDQYQLTSIVGKSGVESQYESLLQGVPGAEQLEVNSHGYLQRVVGRQAPRPGSSVVLSIDSVLQQHLADALVRRLQEVQSTAGVGIALDPRSGEVLAMVSLPSFDNNQFAAGLTNEQYQALATDPLAPLSNRALSGQYPSGSTIKPFVAAAGLSEGVITEQTTINAPGEIRIGEFVFPDWKVHGITDVKKALAVSSNVFFYAVGGGWDTIPGLGIQRLDDYLVRFGFGSPTNIDLSGEAKGLVPTPAWKKDVRGEGWYTGDTYHLSIGQGDLLVTPLQLAAATAAIANNGTLVVPHVFHGEQNFAAQPSFTLPEQSRSVNVDQRALNIVRAGMRQGVESGSSRRLQSLPVSSAGKTGTAQFGTEDKTHAWFIAFAPYEEPEIAITILIEGGGAGNEVALPVAEEVLQHYFRHE